MTIQLFNWPNELLRPKDPDWQYNPRLRSGGVATNGYEQTVSSGAGRWEASLNFELGGQGSNTIPAWRSVINRLKDHSSFALMEMFDLYHHSHRYLFDSTQEFSTFGDGGIFDDGSVFSMFPEVQVALAAEQHDRLVALDLSSVVRPIQPGGYISINNWGHTIVGVSSNVIDIRPGLREAAQPGDVISFYPQVIVKIEPKITGTIQQGRGGTQVIKVHEVLDRRELT